MKILTIARDLRRKRAREERGMFVCEGVRSLEELLRSPLQVVGALVTEGSTPQSTEPATPAGRRAAVELLLRERGIPIETVGPGEFASAAETETPQGVLAIAQVPERSLKQIVMSNHAKIVLMDAIQDPGNAGAIVRTAAALGAAATLALPGTVDLWNAKVVRSAMGAHFHHLAFPCTWDDLDAFRAEAATVMDTGRGEHRAGFALWGADAAGDPLDEVEPPHPLALAFGNEGSGLTAAARSRADKLVALPLAPGAESLNVAVAAGIFLYQLRSGPRPRPRPPAP